MIGVRSVVNGQSDTELVVLLDDQLRPIGTAPKAAVHTTKTPLHQAFSCYVFGRDGRVLLTRRALEKKTWPGVWTNSFCGHPGPEERWVDAIDRRGRQELGLAVANPRVAIADFRYRAVDATGVMENEFCPVWTAAVDCDPHPNVTEVCEWRWAAWPDVVAVVRRMPFLFSPWARLQITQLDSRFESAGMPSISW